MVYNVSYVMNSTGMLQFFQRVNSHILDGWLGTLILLGFAGIMLIAFLSKTEDPGKSVSSTLFITLLLSYMFNIIGLTSTYVVISTLILLMLSVMYQFIFQKT